ncbi:MULTISPECIES: right-handed parallel beta-helix repeat-containing protein [Streptomyces]|uniref:right-handed parallel beta-helix repeat-containing protein n=1 Tax=Streptomyces lycopersici TaxID=2974589 RepID=UPI0021D03E42|nr:right-handed parallel beta-helix repeat-containing protein [Streptomyces sp. NEAU-383]
MSKMTDFLRNGLAAAAAGVLAAVLLTGAATTAEAGPEQLYVAPWGRDTWPGTEQRPFATLARAQQAVRERTPRMTSDLVVNLRGGTHRLADTLKLTDSAGDSGRHGHRVIYQAYGYGGPRQERVTVSGGCRIGGWRPLATPGGAWRADVGDLDTRQLYVEGRRAPRTALGKGLPGEVRETKTGYVTDSPVPRSWRDPGAIEFAYTLPFWVDARCGVAAISGSGRHTAITMDEPCWRMARALYEEDGEPLGGPTDILGSPSFLRNPGSWHLDRSRPGHHVLHYLPSRGQDMTRAKVVAPALQTLVSGTGRADRPLHDITFRGLTFAHATWLEPGEPAGFVSAWTKYKRPGVKTWLTVPGNVVLHRADRITLQGNRFTHLGAQALEISKSSSHNTVEGNEFTDVSAGGVLLGAVPPDTRGTNTGNRIANNWIHQIGVEHRGAAGIWNIATRDTTIAHNQVNDVPYSGIQSGPDTDRPGTTSRTRILNNRVFRTNQVLNDGGGIYIRGEQGSSFDNGALLSGNVVTDSRQGDFNIGLYTDDATNWVTVRDNVVHSYLASVGGCDEPGRPVRNIRYLDNFWDDTVPTGIVRRPYPGAWPSTADGCGDPKNLTFTDNTLLPPTDSAHACATIRSCATVVTNAPAASVPTLARQALSTETKGTPCTRDAATFHGRPSTKSDARGGGRVSELTRLLAPGDARC